MYLYTYADSFLLQLRYENYMSSELPQVGDVAVLDISATTIEQDGTTVQKIPSAETKGLTI